MALAEVRERPSANKRATQEFDIQTFTAKKLNDVEIKNTKRGQH
jgi:hypothetical protein